MWFFSFTKQWVKRTSLEAEPAIFGSQVSDRHPLTVVAGWNETSHDPNHGGRETYTREQLVEFERSDSRWEYTIVWFTFIPELTRELLSATRKIMDDEEAGLPRREPGPSRY